MIISPSIRILLRIQLGITILFILFKVIRSQVVKEELATWVKVFLYSFPNFAEAIVGPMTVCGLVLMANNRFLKEKTRLSNQFIYTITIVFSGVYVILQEFKIHNLGGRNVYDLNDVIFSVIGLLTSYGIFLWLKPNIKD